MAVTQKIRGNSPKVRNSNRTPGYWMALAKSRDNKGHTLVSRHPHTGINFPNLTDVGSAAYRRRQVR